LIEFNFFIILLIGFSLFVMYKFLRIADGVEKMHGFV